MKELEKGELVTLDDKAEYLVLDRIPCGLTTYLYLLLTNKDMNFQIAKEEMKNQDIYLTMIEDEDEKRYVLDRYERLRETSNVSN